MDYMKPEIEILEFELVDVIQTSAGGNGESEDGEYNENEMPLG